MRDLIKRREINIIKKVSDRRHNTIYDSRHDINTSQIYQNKITPQQKHRSPMIL